MEEQEQHPESSSTNIQSSDLDAETVKKLRGDAIGDTVYSESFVVKTLMQFSDLKWCEKFEEELCFIWDMSEEQDVCKYLIQVSYPELACQAITNYTELSLITEPRFIEIVVGIFTNILCSKCYNHIKKEEIEVILNLVHSDNPYILIQVMRFLHVISFIFDKLDFVNEDYFNRFSYILDNSTNKELLSISLKAMSAITEDLKLSTNIVNSGLFSASITAFTSLNYNTMFESQDEQTNVNYLVKIACNLCVYVDSFDNSDLRNELSVYLPVFFSEINHLLCYFTKQDNLLPIHESFTFYIEALIYICRVLNAKYASNIVGPLCKMLLIIVQNKNAQGLNLCGELLCYFLGLESEDLGEEMRRMPWMKPVFLALEDSNFTCDFDYLANLRNIVNNYK